MGDLIDPKIHRVRPRNYMCCWVDENTPVIQTSKRHLDNESTPERQRKVTPQPLKKYG